jgi:hypothetical protein
MNEETHCGCWDEDVRHVALSLAAPQPMPPRSAFTDDCNWIRHYCKAHWAQRVGVEHEHQVQDP